MRWMPPRQDEDAAASVGIDVTREKLKITAISAAMCAFGGAIYGQYQMYIGPDTIAGLGLSLNIVFAVHRRGHLDAARARRSAPCSRRSWPSSCASACKARTRCKPCSGQRALALDTMIYGLLLVLFIIYMPKGILGTLIDRWSRKR